ncbi:Battenin [Aphelenchoides fujianensis]|nr:Battenin [Aphelenchoides fujianensis]
MCRAKVVPAGQKAASNRSEKTSESKRWWKFSDLAAFWIFGLSNNMAYVIMLSAAQDMIFKEGGGITSGNSTVEQEAPTTLDASNERICGEAPLGPVLLADVIPLFVVKCAFPFQHVLAVLMQTISYLVVAFSTNLTTSLIGVVFASIGSGIGEVCYLALASHYSKHMISSWSSGTGGAGLAGALVYAVLTEPHLLNLTPQITLLSMLIVPMVFFFTYFLLLTPSPTVYPLMKLSDPSTWLVLGGEAKLPYSRKSSGSLPIEERGKGGGEERECRSGPSTASLPSIDVVQIDSSTTRPSFSFSERLRLMAPLLKYMIPLCVVYFAQYLIAQGLSEFTVFDCAHGFGLSLKSEYRWFQVVSQLGVFITRSSVSFYQLPVFVLVLLPFLQVANAGVFFSDALLHVVPHLWINFVLMFCQGLIAGASYVNSFYRIHKEVDPAVKEFSLAITSAANAVGIAAAGVASIPTHQFICSFGRT